MFDLYLFTTQTTGTSTLAPEIKEYYEKVLLKNAEPALIHDQCAEKVTIPKGNGKKIEWRKFTSLPKATTALTEGVTPTPDDLAVTTVEGQVYQYGSYVEYSDLLDIEAIDPVISETAELQGSQSGRTLNSLTRDVLATATNKAWPNGKTARTALTASDTITLTDIFNCAAILKANNIPTYDGTNYVCYIHPYIMNDLMLANITSQNGWMDIAKYIDPSRIIKGEVGKIGGVRFVESSECKIWSDSTCPTGVSVFQTLFIGQKAYAVTELAGAGLQYIVKPLGSGDDPLNQRGTLGWKATRGATILDQTRLLSLETACATKPAAAAN